MTILTITDARRVFCVQGLKKFMESSGIDFRAFVQHGISEDEVRQKTGMNAEIDRIVIAKIEAENGN